jgi:S-adenosylmethionine synthetase
MGRKNEIIKKSFNAPGGGTKTVEVELFTWEKLDFVDKIRTAFKIK